jgi:hypothetical protein
MRASLLLRALAGKPWYCDRPALIPMPVWTHLWKGDEWTTTLCFLRFVRDVEVDLTGTLDSR